MTNYRKTLTIAAMAIWTAALPAAEKPAPAQAALKAAMDKEMVDGDLKSAIALYEKTAAEFRTDRATAAKALLRIGQCYEKLGTVESRKAYERVVREYSDQGEQAAFAKGRLSALGRSIASVGVSVRQVWTKPAAMVNTNPVFRDGRRLAYIDGSDHENLVVADMVTGENKRLTDAGPGGGAGYPAVSPDSRFIAYQWWNKRVAEVRVVGADGSSPRVLYSNPEVEPEPVIWFPDGKHLLANFFLKEKTMQIAVISGADGKARILKSSPWGRRPGSVRLSPDGRYIAFDMPESSAASESDIYLMASDGSSETVLIRSAGDDLLLDWTPDGKELFFLSDRGGSMSVWAVPMSGKQAAGEPRIVKANVGSINSLGFDRNGSFYYTEAVHAGIEVFAASLDPATGKITEAPRIASNRHVGTKGFAAYSPDGNFLAYQSGLRKGPSGFSAGGLTIQSLDTGKEYDLSTSMEYLRMLRYGDQIVVQGGERTRGFGLFSIDPRTGEVSPRDPSPKSPDGKKLRSSQRVDGGWRLVERDLETGQETVVVPDRFGAFQTNWIMGSPGGEWIAYLATGAGETRLMAVRTGGGDPLTLVSVKGTTAIPAGTWTKDGRYILFAQGVNGDDEVWRVPISGGKPQATGFKAKGIQQISVHPDGKRVVVTSFANGQYNETSHSVWLMENYQSALQASR